jgi:hypothetical protein
MKYQLVLQWPAHSIKDYDNMVVLEESIAKVLGAIGTVDGHDAGAGEMNIFILTDNPILAFDCIKMLLGTKDFIPDLKAAFREVGKDAFTIVHPPKLSHFSVA